MSAPFPFPDNSEGSFGYDAKMIRLQVSDNGAVHVTHLRFQAPSDAFISLPKGHAPITRWHQARVRLGLRRTRCVFCPLMAEP